MFKYLPDLKNKGYVPDTILDIGAHHGDWTASMMNIYPNSKYYLFEGINYKELERFKNNSNVTIKNVLLNDKIEEVDWWEEKNTGDSFFKEKSKFFVNTNATKRTTIDLDTIMDRDNILKDTKNVFIKIDCQGAEIPILKGSKQILVNTDFIVLEMPLFGKYNEGVPTFTEHIQFMDELGFISFDIVESHYINGFNMQVDMLFVNKTSEFYLKFANKPIIHSVMLSNFQRQHVINYIKKKKQKNTSFKVIDIGGSATAWSYPVIDYIVDINEPEHKYHKIKYFALNVNFENDFKKLLDYVNKNGKFDFCICSHIIEDISLPQVMLNNLKNIAKEGFIGITSKYRELSRIYNNNYTGYIHHRWIYSIINNELIGFPKVNFIDYEKKLLDIGDSSDNLLDLSFFWKNGVKYSIINNNYLGPSTSAVIKYYDKLIVDDVDKLKEKGQLYHIEFIKQHTALEGEMLSIIMLIDNLVSDLKIMEGYNFIPYNIIKNSDTLGVIDLHIVFINKTHKFNNIVQEKLFN